MEAYRCEVDDKGRAVLMPVAPCLRCGTRLVAEGEQCKRCHRWRRVSVRRRPWRRGVTAAEYAKRTG